MAVQSESISKKVVARLSVGTTATGAPKYANVSIGSISKDRYATENGDTKAVAIINALVPCFEYSLGQIQKTSVDELYED